MTPTTSAISWARSECSDMPNTLAERSRSMPLKSLDDVELRPAKAGLTGQARSIALTTVVKDALQRHYGSLKAAAISMGQMDQGQLTRELETGKFRFERLELCDDEAKAFIAGALYEAFGQLTDPRARGRHLVREMRQRLEEFEQLLEHVS